MVRADLAVHLPRMDVTVTVSLKGLTTVPGSGLRCDACQQPIERNQVECRWADGDRASSARLRLHQWCYYARSQLKTGT
jgi:hypothetical protein